METVTRLKKDAALSGVDLFEALVDAWEFIVTENASEVHLVTSEQADTWKKFQNEMNVRLEKVGVAFTKYGVWENTEMQTLRVALGSHVHKTGEQIIQEGLAKLSKENAIEVKVRKTKSLMERLRKLR